MEGRGVNMVDIIFISIGKSIEAIHKKYKNLNSSASFMKRQMEANAHVKHIELIKKYGRCGCGPCNVIGRGK